MDADQLIVGVILVLVVAGIAWSLRFCWRVIRGESGATAETCEHCSSPIDHDTGVCPVCGEMIGGNIGHLNPVALRDDWPVEPKDVRTPGPDEGWTIVFESTSGDEAMLLCQQLQARGIAASYRQEEAETVLHGQPDGMCDYFVGVPSRDVGAAHVYIESVRGTRRPPRPLVAVAITEQLVCDFCSYDMRATPERCPECGLAPGPPEPGRFEESDEPQGPPMRRPAPDEKLVVAYRTTDAFEARHVWGELLSAGIPAEVEGEAYRNHVQAPLRVVVWSGDANRAKRILDDEEHERD